jgi:hypothetical protein
LLETRRKIGSVTVDRNLREAFEVAVEAAATLNIIVDKLISEAVQEDSKSHRRVALLLYHYLAAHCMAASEKLFRSLTDKAATEPEPHTAVCMHISNHIGREESIEEIFAKLERKLSVNAQRT